MSQGSITFPDGIKYIGGLKYNKPYGHGTKFLPEPKPIFYNNTKYVGEFKYGLLNGQAMITYANGTKFVGNFRDGSYYGQGTLVDSKGNRFIGKYKNNKLIKKN